MRWRAVVKPPSGTNATIGQTIAAVTHADASFCVTTTRRVHRDAHREDAGQRAGDVLLVHAVERDASRLVLLREGLALLLDVADVVLGVPAEAAEQRHAARVVEDAVYFREPQLKREAIFRQRRLLGVVGQVEVPDFFTSSSSKWSSATTTLSKPLNWALSARGRLFAPFFFLLGLRAFFSAFAAFARRTYARADLRKRPTSD